MIRIILCKLRIDIYIVCMLQIGRRIHYDKSIFGKAVYSMKKALAVLLVLALKRVRAREEKEDREIRSSISPYRILASLESDLKKLTVKSCLGIR